MPPLPHRPAAFAVGGIELCWRQAFYRRAQLAGRFGDDFDGLLPQCWRRFERLLEFANRVARIHGAGSPRRKVREGFCSLDGVPRTLVTNRRQTKFSTKRHPKWPDFPSSRAAEAMMVQ